MNRSDKYSNLAMLLHWSMALMILALFVLGWYMEDLPKGSDERSYFFKLHKSLGVTVFFLLLIRILWAFIDQRPPLPESLKAWQRKLAAAVHHSLYLMMLIHPLTGYISSSFTKYSTSVWGLFKLPKLAEENTQMNDFFTGVHEVTAILLFVLILIHLLGAFAFVFSKHTYVLNRMLPGKH